jgi:cytochrome d ubiquinol oxidase subunit II
MLSWLPLVFVLIGLVLYVVLGGADFGAGFWQLAAGRGGDGERIREHAHHSMGPVWEANHVWLIFVITVLWTAYPVAFGSVASTLELPLFVAAIGIIFRGGAYALRSGASGPREIGAIETVTGISSILTPFSLGLVVGAIAAGRVPVGNAVGGSLTSSWLSPVPLVIGVLAVAVSAYLAAVFLAADAARHGHPDLERAMRWRALGAGLVAGAMAVVGLIVLRADAHRLYAELTSGGAVVVVAVSAVAGVVTLGFVLARRYELARYSSAAAVAAVIAAWAIAQQPRVLPGLTVRAAAAPHDTLVAVTVAVLAGGVILFPSLGLLFGLLLRGRLHDAAAVPEGRLALRAEGGTARADGGSARAGPSAGLLARAAGACLIAGIGLLNAADAPWAHLIGVLALLAFVPLAFAALFPGNRDWAAAGDDPAA